MERVPRVVKSSFVAVNFFNVNTALRACVTALYGQELATRDQAAKLARIKATAGENGGAHDRGFQVVTWCGTSVEDAWRNNDEGIIVLCSSLNRVGRSRC